MAEGSPQQIEIKISYSGLWKEAGETFSKNPWIISGFWLLIFSLSFADTAEVIPSLSPLVNNPVFPYFHEVHDIFAMAIASYLAFRYGIIFGFASIFIFFASHSYYIYRQISRESVEMLRIFAFFLADIVIVILMEILRRSRKALLINIERVRAGSRRIEGFHGLAIATYEASDINSLFRKAIPHIKEATGMELISCHGFTKETNQLLLITQIGWNYNQAHTMSLFPSSALLEKATPSSAIIVENEPSRCPGPIGSLMCEAGARSCIIIPLTVENNTLGVIILGSKREIDISDDSMLVFSSLGREMSLHLNRIMMISKTESQRVSLESGFRALVENMSEGVVLMDKDLKISYVNPTYCKFVGYSREELIGREAGTGDIDSESINRVKENISLRKKGISSTYEYNASTKDGRKIPLLVSGAPVIDNEGKFQGVVAIFTNLSEIKKLQQEKDDILHQSIKILEDQSESNARFLTIVENMAEAMVLIDKNWLMIDINPAYTKLTGYSKEEVIGKKAGEVSAAPGEQERLNKELSLRQQGISGMRQMMLKTKSGELIPVHVSAAPILDQSGTFMGSIAILTDLREINKLQQEKEKLVRLGAIGEMAAIVAHELRNPLGAINNSLYFLRTRLKETDEKVSWHLDLINYSLTSSNKIISDLLEYARPLAPVLYPVSLNMLVEEALARFSFRTDVKVSKELDPSLPLLKLDAEMMMRVFINLFANSLDAMHEGGILRVSTMMSAEQVEATVEDTGTGMTPEVMSQIFNPFFSTKTKGVGLGLYICKQILEKHRGKINVESQTGKGTTITVTLPLENNAEKR